MGRFLNVTDVPVTIDHPSDYAAELNHCFPPTLGLKGINASCPHAPESSLGRRVWMVLVTLEGPLVPCHYIIAWIWSDIGR
jgi:hypothetical protein